MCIGFFTLVGACMLCMRIYTYSNITWHVQPFPNHVTSHNLAAVVCVWYMYMHGCRVMRMDPNFSTTLLNLLSSVPGADSLPQKFPLLFSNSQNPMSQQQASHDSSLETPQGNCTTKVGTQVNVITGGSSGTIGQLNVKSPGAVVSKASKESDMIDIPIKVVNPTNKRESKTYMLSLQLEKMASLTCMYWNSWGSVVSVSLQFDVGYFSGIHKICFVKIDIRRYTKIQYKLWAEALDIGKHQSKEEPPRGPIWGDQKPTKNAKKDTDCSVDRMASAFTHMANTIASAIIPSVKANTPTKSPHLSHSEVGISPGRRIEL